MKILFFLEWVFLFFYRTTPLRIFQKHFRISKLNAYGVDNIELEWFSDYLFNRKQRVCYGNTLSDEEGVFSGVPQGSILGPLLFILYFDDFQTCLKHSDPIKYADDTVIYVAGKDPIIIESRLSADMQAIAD